MKRLLIGLFVLVIAACAQTIRLTTIATGIPDPTDIQSSNDGSGRLFLVQQNGIVRIFRNGALVPQPFLDIRSKTRSDGERGLLGLAFPPDFAARQRFYVNYNEPTGNGNTIIAQYRVSADPDVADVASEVVILRISQPFSNHKGGQLRFGPDGYLYIGMGDGGSGGDPQRNGQNRNALLGKMLRIDVESEPGRVRIPPDNPFVNMAGSRGEIWAIGVRNPWRFSFDRATGDLWMADVGQENYEEVNFQPAGSRGGENYGWNFMEGAHCYLNNCSMSGLVLPVAEYSHALGCSVTGGFVYRGRLAPGLRGVYLYTDYCSGRIWGIERQGAEWVNRQLMTCSGCNISTFGEDESGELYVANADNGSILRVEGAPAPRLSAAGVVNAASFARGLTPGSLATAFAAGILDQPGVAGASRIPLPEEIAGVSVTVDGRRAPIHVVANSNGQEQVNFQAPFEIRGRTSVSVVVSRTGQSSETVDVPVLDLQPAIYSGAVVHNQDYSLVDAARPLAPNEHAFFYASGVGRVANEPVTGAAAPAFPLASTIAAVQVTLAGISCDVPFAGMAPGFVGVYQVNFRAPANAPSGLQDLIVTVGSVSSPAVKVAVR